MKRIPEELKDVLVSTPDTVSGAIRFAGTRVMIEVFLDTIASGWSFEATLKSFPTIPRDGAVAVLEYQSNLVKRELGIEDEAHAHSSGRESCSRVSTSGPESAVTIIGYNGPSAKGASGSAERA